LEITGEYTGSIGGYGASHERRRGTTYNIQNYNDSRKNYSASITLLQQQKVKEQEQKATIIDKLLEIKSGYKGL